MINVDSVTMNAAGHDPVLLSEFKAQIVAALIQLQASELEKPVLD